VTNSAKMTTGCAVELGSGAVLRDVRKTSKTGSRWQGIVVRKGHQQPGQHGDRRIGFPSVFHSSSFRRVLTADELAAVTAEGGAK